MTNDLVFDNFFSKVGLNLSNFNLFDYYYILERAIIIV
jgi:hypothetical protein